MEVNIHLRLFKHCDYLWSIHQRFCSRSHPVNQMKCPRTFSLVRILDAQIMITCVVGTLKSLQLVQELSSSPTDDWWSVVHHQPTLITPLSHASSNPIQGSHQLRFNRYLIPSLPAGAITPKPKQLIFNMYRLYRHVLDSHFEVKKT